MPSEDAQPRRDYLDRMFADVEKWSQRSQTHVGDVQPGSELAADTALSSKWRVGESAASAWSTSVDNLDAVKHMFETVVHPFAPYSLLRVAVENAAMSVWLLAPDDQGERITRRLRLAWWEIAEVETVMTLIGIMPPGKTPDEQRQQVKDVCRDAGLDQSVVCGRFAWQDVVTNAATSVAIDPPYLVEFIWRLCSGFAHGRDWARLAWLRREQTITSATDDGLISVAMTSDTDQMTAPVFATHQLLKAAARLYDQRRLAWKTH